MIPVVITHRRQTHLKKILTRLVRLPVGDCVKHSHLQVFYKFHFAQSAQSDCLKSYILT